MRAFSTVRADAPPASASASSAAIASIAASPRPTVTRRRRLPVPFTASIADTPLSVERASIAAGEVSARIRA